jgi:hypothetical protein
VQWSLSEIHTYMRKRQPYVTGIGHLAGYAGLQTILLFTLWNSRFWSYTKPNIHCIPSALSNFLEINDYGLYDPAWWNSLPTPELDQLLELNAHSAEYIFHLISLYLWSSTSSDTEKQTTNP